MLKKFRDRANKLTGRGTAISGSTPNDDRVGMMASVTPAPGGGFAQHHERSQFVEGVIHPVGFESRAMTGFMPARVGYRGVQDTINSKRDHSPPCPPEVKTDSPKDQQQRKPKDSIPDRRAIAAFEQLAHLYLRNRRGIPFCFGQTILDCQGCISSHQTIIPGQNLAHMILLHPTSKCFLSMLLDYPLKVIFSYQQICFAAESNKPNYKRYVRID